MRVNLFDCPKCKGAKYIWDGSMSAQEPCPECAGWGQVAEQSETPNKCCENGNFGDGHKCMKSPGHPQEICHACGETPATTIKDGYGYCDWHFPPFEMYRLRQDTERKTELLDALYEMTTLSPVKIDGQFDGYEWYIQFRDPSEDDEIKDRERFYRAIEAQIPQ